MNDLVLLQERIAYSFQDVSLLQNALIHSSYAYERSHDQITVEDNERLEFLGDGLIDFIVGETLYRRMKNRDEGYLSKTRALIVCESTLSSVAIGLGVGEMLLLGKGEEQSGGRKKPSNLANAMEAIFAAVFLDGGFDAAKTVVLTVLKEYMEDAIKGELVFDYKSKILELAQTKGHAREVQFVIASQDGPVHERIFTAHLLVNGSIFAQGTGSSKKLAEQAAAKAAYPSFRKHYHI